MVVTFEASRRLRARITARFARKTHNLIDLFTFSVTLPSPRSAYRTIPVSTCFHKATLLHTYVDHLNVICDLAVLSP